MKIEAIIDEKLFARFTWFDLLKRRKLWRAPVTFASILGVCAIICYIMHHVEGAVLLGTVLLVVGLGMPVFHFVNLYLNIRSQIRKQDLKNPKLVYTLRLTPDANGIAIENGTQQASYPWKQVYHAYRDQDAVYLYLHPERAFLLPYSGAEQGEEALWALISKKVPKDKCTDLR